MADAFYVLLGNLPAPRQQRFYLVFSPISFIVTVFKLFSLQAFPLTSSSFMLCTGSLAFSWRCTQSPLCRCLELFFCVSPRSQHSTAQCPTTSGSLNFSLSLQLNILAFALPVLQSLRCPKAESSGLSSCYSLFFEITVCKLLFRIFCPVFLIVHSGKSGLLSVTQSLATNGSPITIFHQPGRWAHK